MSNTIALIPARAGSKGIPGKNFRLLGGKPLYGLAAECAIAAGIPRIVVSTDAVEHPCGVTSPAVSYQWSDAERRYVSVPPKNQYNFDYLPRPAELAQDDTPMFDVVQHAAETLQLADDDIIVLLQPTAPFRTPERVREAIALLRESGADSVVSVVELPRTHSPVWVCEIDDQGYLAPWPDKGDVEGQWFARPTRRQDVPQVYRPDGSVYCIRVEALRRCKDLFGADVRPLIIPPDETCELDTEADWAALEARWKERHEAQ